MKLAPKSSPMTVTVLRAIGKYSRKRGLMMTRNSNLKAKKRYHKYRKSEPKKSKTKIKFSIQKLKKIKTEKYKFMELQIHLPTAARDSRDTFIVAHGARGITGSIAFGCTPGQTI